MRKLDHDEPWRLTGPIRRSRLPAHLSEALRRPRVYFVAFFVGTVINLYGQIIVPYTRGDTDVWGRFIRELDRYPLTVGLSVAIAYVFPLMVGVFQTVATLRERERE